MHARQLLGRWPWRPSTAAGLPVLALMALLYAGEPMRGIALASATNMATVAFCLVGGLVLACRPRPGSSWPRFLMASVAGAATAAVLCWAAVVGLRVVILPLEPLTETVFQDGFGRASTVFEVAAPAGALIGSFRRILGRVAANGPR